MSITNFVTLESVIQIEINLQTKDEFIENYKIKDKH